MSNTVKRHQNLFSPEVQALVKLPPLIFESETDVSPLAKVKFYKPDKSWIWYASRFDGLDIFFGLVKGIDVEMGCFRLSELQRLRYRDGSRIKRDPHFIPTSLAALYELHKIQY